MSQVNNSGESTSVHNLPPSLAASLDVEELERRLELSDMEAVSEAEAMEYAAAAGWEVSGTGSGPPAKVEVTAKKSW